MFRGLADDLDLDGFLARLLPAEGACCRRRPSPPARRSPSPSACGPGSRRRSTCTSSPRRPAAVAAAAGFDLRGGPVFVEFPGADGRRSTSAWRGPPSCSTATPPRPALGLPAQHVPARRGPAARRRRPGRDARRPGPRPRLRDRGRAGAVRATATAARRSRCCATPGCSGPGTVLAHGVHLDDPDLELVAASGASVAHCPASNQKLASGFARIPDLLAAGVPVALGTDGAASANDLDPWLAMRLAAYPLAARDGSARSPPPTSWRMATTGGAPAVGDPRHRLDRGRHARRPRRPRPVVAGADAVVRRRCRPPPTRRRGPTCAGSSPAAASSSTTGLTTIDVEAAIAAVARPRPADRRPRPAPMNVDEARDAVHAACLRMVADGLVIGSAGNISVRVDERPLRRHRRRRALRRADRRPTTPSSTPRDRRVGRAAAGRPARSPCTSACCGAMPDVGAVVHTHSRYAAAFSVARLDLPFICNESIATRAERVLVTDYAPPGSADLGDQALARSAPARQPGRAARQPRCRRHRPDARRRLRRRPVRRVDRRDLPPRPHARRPPAPASTCSTARCATRSPATTASRSPGDEWTPPP